MNPVLGKFMWDELGEIVDDLFVDGLGKDTDVHVANDVHNITYIVIRW